MPLNTNEFHLSAYIYIYFYTQIWFFSFPKQFLGLLPTVDG